MHRANSDALKQSQGEMQKRVSRVKITAAIFAYPGISCKKFWHRPELFRHRKLTDNLYPEHVVKAGATHG